MKCDDLNDALVDFVDGRLDTAAQPGVPAARTLRGGVERDVERHLEVCDQCAALVTDRRTIRAAAFMLDRREPSPATWTGRKDLQKASSTSARRRRVEMPEAVWSS